MSEPNASVNFTVEEAHFIKGAFQGVTVNPTIPEAADYCRSVAGIAQKCDAIIAREVAKQAENPTDGTEPAVIEEVTPERASDDEAAAANA